MQQVRDSCTELLSCLELPDAPSTRFTIFFFFYFIYMRSADQQHQGIPEFLVDTERPDRA